MHAIDSFYNEYIHRFLGVESLVKFLSLTFMENFLFMHFWNAEEIIYFESFWTKAIIVIIYIIPYNVTKNLVKETCSLVNREDLLLSQDNVTPYCAKITRQIIAKLGSKVLFHPSYLSFLYELSSFSRFLFRKTNNRKWLIIIEI